MQFRRGQTDNEAEFQSSLHYHLLEGVVIDESGLFEDRLKEWEERYNFTRPHGGLGRQTPHDRLRHKTGISM